MKWIDKIQEVLCFTISIVVMLAYDIGMGVIALFLTLILSELKDFALSYNRPKEYNVYLKGEKENE